MPTAMASLVGSLSVCSLVALHLFLIQASAATLTVCDEPSLRTAIAAGGTINFGCVGVITLGDTIRITNNVVLNGNGRTVTIDGQNAVRLFQVTPNGTLTLRGITLAHGFHQGAA